MELSMGIFTRFWQFMSATLFGRNSLKKLATSAQNTMDKLLHRKKKDKHQGTLIWNSKSGTYRRGTPKIGRNAVCPCGAMRVAPRDVTKRNKYKWCCGVPKS